MSVPMLHRAEIPLARYGPFEPAQRYWHGSAPEYDVVAFSVDGRRLLVGEAKWSAKEGSGALKAEVPGHCVALPGATGVEAGRARFVPDAIGAGTEAEVVDARTVMGLLR